MTQRRSATERYGALIGDDLPFLRQLGLAVDVDPEALSPHLDHPLFVKILHDFHSTCPDKAQLYESVAYADMGLMFTAPRPCLSGLFLKEVGTKAEQEAYNDFVIRHKARTFFAVTEPGVGSDAVKMQTSLTPEAPGSEHYRLTGEKWLFGNACLGKIGVVLARTSPGPLGIMGVLVTPDDSLSQHIHREPLPMGGMRAAQLGYVRYTDYPIAQHQLLGRTVNPIERGTLALVKTFNKMRVCVCALALGASQALLDLLHSEHPHLPEARQAHFTALENQLNYLRQLTYEVAHILEEKPLENTRVSIIKYKLTQLLETLAQDAVEALGPGALLRYPWLAHLYRNAFALEYTEGSTDIHKKNLYQSYIKGQL